MKQIAIAFWPKRVMALALLATVTACDGGGGGGPRTDTFLSTAIKSTNSYTEGVFYPSSNFSDLCLAPRVGIDSTTALPFPDSQGTSIDENNWLRSWSNELYLWYDEIIDVDPSLNSTPEYFDLMRTFARTPSGRQRDRFHFLMPTDEWVALSQSGVSAGYGAEFAILQGTPPRRVAVAYTEPGSPATSASVQLVRGALILEVDGVDLVNANTNNDIDTLNAGMFPSNIGETHTFRVQDPDGLLRDISMTSASITSDPVQNVSIIPTASGPVGYMLFNDHIATSEQQLIDAIDYFATQGITDLMLDLRYNGGGYLDIASELAFMVAGPAAASGRTFDELKFSDKHTAFNPVTGESLSPTPFSTTARGFSAPAGTALPSVNLPRLFVLTSSGTCSASEAIMNGLRGIDIEVIQIGSTTCGKPYGFYVFDNCGTSYFSIMFKGVNEKGFGDYSDGFSPINVTRIEGTPVPGCSVADDFTHQLGDPLEARLNAALTYRVDGSCPTPSGYSSVIATSELSFPPMSAVTAEVPKNFWLQNRIVPGT